MKKDMEQFLHKFIEKIGSYLEGNSLETTPVVEYVKATELEEKIDLSLELKGKSLDDIFSMVEEYLHYSVRTSHPNFANQLYMGFNFPAFVGEMVVALTNTSMATFEIAPLANLIENKIINKMNGLIGWYAQDDTPGGIMVPGGSYANMVAMLMARNKICPTAKQEGMPHNKFVLFVSDRSHYSFDKGVNILGIGTKNCITVASDKHGRMIPEALAEAIVEAKAKKLIPFFVAATSGTTVHGAFDPLNPIAKICKKNNLWFHIDGAWGGSVLLSKKHRNLLDGCHQADSFTWDAHKMMGVPFHASMILCKNKKNLCEASAGGGESYIFHNTENDQFDSGPNSLQCGRRVDCLKIWFAWKHLGDEGYEKLINDHFDRAIILTKMIQDNSRLELICEPQSLNICFRVLPNDPTGGKEFDLNSYNLALREKLVAEGKFLVNYSTDDDGTIFFRYISSNPMVTKDYLDKFIKTLLEMEI